MTEHQPNPNQPQQPTVPQQPPAPVYSAQPPQSQPQPQSYPAYATQQPPQPQQPPTYPYGYPSSSVYGISVDAPPTGGAKAGYFALSFFLGILGMVICYAIAKDKGPQHVKAAFLFSIVAQACAVAFSIFIAVFFEVALFGAMDMLDYYAYC